MKASLLVGVFDLPARAMTTNMTQYNCLDKGEHVSGRHLFLPEHETRIIAHMEECAKEAEESGELVYGVKGMSML